MGHRRESAADGGVEALLARTYGQRAVGALSDFLAFAGEVDRIIVSKGRETFLSSRVLQLAAEALLQKLGEAANRLPEQFRADHPEIPWRALRGMRNVVAHQYHLVDHDIVWQAAAESLPPVVRDVNLILGR